MRRDTSSASPTIPAQPPPSKADNLAQRHRYSGIMLTALAIGCIAELGFLFVTAALTPSNPQGDAPGGLLGALEGIAALIWFGMIVLVLIVDWRGASTLNGLIKWRRMPVWLRIVVGYFALGLSPFLLVFYTFQAHQTYRYFKQQEPLERRHKIAELEAQLGVMPHSEGTCRTCEKPLQIGADYCAYCGTSVIQQPRICPKCATTTFPDAKWCPKCHASLDASPA